MQQSDRAGLLFTLTGFCLLSVGDAIIKGVAGEWTPPAVAAFRYALGAVGLSLFLYQREGRAPFLKVPKPGVQLLRGLAVAGATLAFFGSIWLMPLADAVAITFTQPMFTAMLAAAFLGERLRLHTVAATLVAFAGVLIILRPNFLEIGWAALLPLFCAFCMAVLVTANRAVRGAGSVLAAQAYVAIGGAFTLGLVVTLGTLSGDPRVAFYWPEWHVLLRVAFVACSATAAHWLVFLGTERAGAATVAPMTYGQLLVATSLAWIFFDEAPDAVAMLGAALIVGSGLWLWWLGRRRDLAGTTR
ncbi:DMT family transporter [Aurantiacibacter luteus]|uniref:EamA domain-containing protein n=1 Tax=Aurantiacibacter luteus TaxID=1581420 RepID=A0A0G9MX04_9SPHN|nr:DMT family transporter [Aurantiacibacter luteus]KLE35220.1 hypothetical protein AAW00_01705 [Aurantiacibacter luteus]